MFFIYFNIGIKILFLLTFIFYIVFFSLVLYWAERKITFIIVPLIYTFQFFLIGFIIVIIISFILTYLFR